MSDDSAQILPPGTDNDAERRELVCPACSWSESSGGTNAYQPEQDADGTGQWAAPAGAPEPGDPCPNCGARLAFAGDPGQDGSDTPSATGPTPPGSQDGSGRSAAPRYKARHRVPDELRVVGESKAGVEVAGLAIPYNRRTVIRDAFGEFGETIKRGAASQVPQQDVRLLYGHDGSSNLVFARTRSGTLTLSDTTAGLRFKATLDVEGNSQAADLVSAVERGDLDGMSWAFTVGKDGDQWNDSMTERVVTRFAQVPEISIVWLPAYTNATSVTVTGERSADVEAALAERRRLKAQTERLNIRFRQHLETR